MSAPWGEPGADPLGDIRAFVREAGRLLPPASFVVLALPPLGCADCGMALPSCHQQHGEAHCGRHDPETCRRARG